MSAIDTRELAQDERRERRVERRHVERDDRGAGGRQARHEPVADLAASAGDENDGSSHEWWRS